MKANKSSSYITKHMNNILDIDDLNKSFMQFKKDIIKHNFNNYDKVYCNDKKDMLMRFHQKLMVKKMCQLIEEGYKKILLGCKCRSGKTFMVGGLIKKQKEIKDCYNVLIITPSPSETIPQFTDNLLNRFIDFKDFTIHTINTGKYLKNIELTQNNIIVVSKQLLQKYIGNNTIEKVKNIKLDLIVFDENHFTGTTDLSTEIFKSYSSRRTVKIYLTATYNKPLQKWNIPINCQLYWDIEDEQWCKQMNINELINKHGNVVKTIIDEFNMNGHDKNEIFNIYQKYPNMNLLTNMFDSQRYEIIKEKIMDSKYGFSFEVLFSLNKNKIFNFSDEIKTILRYISGSDKENDFKNGDKSIFTRIDKLRNETNSRKSLIQLWFLPIMNINDISVNLKKLMEEDGVLKKYNIMIINSNNNEITSKDIKLEIKKQERITYKHNKTGLIILAGNMLNLGITLKNCDIVMLLNNTLSADKILQQMYRCMTEAENKYYGYVVDLNVSRVINTCINYNIHNKSLNMEDKIKYLIENHLINIDADYFVNKEINSTKLIEKIINIWRDDPINNFKILLKNLDDNYDEFDNDTQKLINNSFSNTIKDKITMTIEINDEKQDLPTGKEKKQDNTESDNANETGNGGEEKTKEIMISFSKEVLPYVIPLTCILTIKENKKNFIDMLDIVQENKELLEIFDEQSLIWWNSKDLLKIIKKIVKENYDENSNVYNISIQFKLGLQSLIDHPKELLELINDCLKPKKIEKKKFGEVFTPMKLVNEMLDKLPKKVWTNKNLKWLDPANGMGNFPIAIYLRLMKGLREEIKNEKERKRHILENMLYMCELNKKNIFISKQIFDVKDEYKLNLHYGDFLKLQPKETFNVERFDIIVGNPPYQDGSGNKGNKLWTKFVKNILEGLISENGYLLFVHPSLWRQMDHKLQNHMMQRQIIYLEMHNEKDGLKTFFANTRYDWYLLQNKKNTDLTTVKCDDGNICKIDISKMKFIPNNDIELILKLTSSNDKVHILHSESFYEPRKKWMNGEKTDVYKYPCIYSINKKNIASYKYSSVNNKGHFRVPKIIWGGGATGFIIDTEGEFGMTQWASAIVDNIDNLYLIYDAMTSDRFNNLIKSISVSKQEINYKILREFNKDFYKEFL